MSMTISTLGYEDISRFVDIELEAFRSHPRIPMLWPAGYTDDLRAFYLANKRRDLADPRCRFVRAVDDATGEIIAAAEWTFALDPAVLAAEPDVDPFGDPPDDWPRRGNWEMRRFYRINLQYWQRKYLMDRPYIQLDILVTHPSFSRRGAASALLNWGIEHADRDGIVMCLESTPAGLSLYKRFGFREIEVIKANMKQFGWLEPYDEQAARRVWMIREPLAPVVE